MSDSKQTDHWDLLASVLGAEPQKKEPPTESSFQPEEKPLEVVEQAAESFEIEETNAPLPPIEPSTASPVRPLSSWDALAKDLGIEVKPEPTPPPAQTYAPIAKQAVKKVFKPAEQLDEPRREVAQFGQQIEPFEIPEPRSFEETEEPDEKKSRHRRRRRYKGRDKDGSAEEIKKPHSDSRSEAPEEGDMMLSDVPLEADDKADIEIGENLGGEKDEKPHSKHRRSRRGSRKRKKIGDETTQIISGDLKHAGSGEHAEPHATRELSRSSDVGEDIAEEEQEDDQRDDKSTFRAIPTWDEAVGFIITKNIESHPKRQGSGSSRSRSGDRSRRKHRK
jgi:hypothetical protein